MPKYRKQLRYLGPKEELDAARSQEASPDELAILSESQYSFVQEAVADNPRTDPETLAGLVPRSLQHPTDQYIAAAIARNASTPSVALARLAAKVLPFLDNGREHHKHFEIGVALCCNASTPKEAITELLDVQQTSTIFRKVVARETKREDILQLLVLDRSEPVRKLAIENLSGLDNDQ